MKKIMILFSLLSFFSCKKFNETCSETFDLIEGEWASVGDVPNKFLFNRKKREITFSPAVGRGFTVKIKSCEIYQYGQNKFSITFELGNMEASTGVTYKGKEFGLTYNKVYKSISIPNYPSHVPIVSDSLVFTNHASTIFYKL
jgi:hypothetical protein